MTQVWKGIGRWWALVAGLAIWAASLVFVGLYGVDVPVGDQWGMSLVFDDQAAGQVTLTTLLRQANESRPAFPKLIWLGLVATGRWNSHAEMFVTQAVLIGLSVALASICWQTLDGSVRKYVWLGATALLFTWAQWDNFFWGVQSIVYFPGACLTAGLALIGGVSRRRWWLAVALCVVFGTVSTFSYANGMVIWPLFLVALACASGWLRRERAIAVAVVAFATLLNLWLYFHDYVKPGVHPSFLIAFEKPIEFLQAFLAYCGSPLAVEPRRFPSAIAVGAVASLLTAWGLVYTLKARRDHDFFRRALPWVLLAAYGFGTGVVTTLGRLGFGPEYLLAPRYVAFSSVGLAAVLGLCAVCVSSMWNRDGAPRIAIAAATAVVVGAAAVMFTLNALDSLQQSVYLRDSRLRAQATLRFLDAAEDIDVQTLVYWPGAGMIRQRAPVLQSIGVLVPQPTRIDWVASTEVLGKVEAFEPAAPSQFHAVGWAYFAKLRRVPDAILVTDEGASPRKVLRLIVRRLYRPEVGTPAPHVGFDTTFTAPEGARLGFWAFDARRARAFALCANPGACVPFAGAANAMFSAPR
jgi:hypothetical protein